MKVFMCIWLWQAIIQTSTWIKVKIINRHERKQRQE